MGDMNALVWLQSRGPQGLQLEVGARRAPRLLVSHIIKDFTVFGLKKICETKSCVHG